MLTKPVQILQHLNFLDTLPQAHTLVHMPVVSAGQIDGICIWFDMHLDDNSIDDDSTIVSTTPALSISDSNSSVTTTSGWDQAIYFIKQNWHIADSSNDSIDIKVSYSEDRFSFEDTNGVSVHTSDQQSNSQTQTYKISEMEVSLLNNHSYTNAYGAAVSAAAKGKHVLDLCSDSWLNTVTVAAAVHSGAATVTVCCKSDEQLQCINSIADKCNTAQDTVCHISCDDIMTTLQRLQQREDVAAVEVIVTDLMEPSGLIRQGAIEDLSLAVTTACTQQRVLKHQQHRSDTTHTSTTTSAAAVVVIPSSLTVVFQGYHCNDLDAQRRVHSDRTVGIDVSSINSYGVNIIDAVQLSEYTPVTSIEQSEDLLYQIGSSSDSNNEDLVDTIVLTAKHYRLYECNSVLV
jgi:hypothetical protein